MLLARRGRGRAELMALWDFGAGWKRSLSLLFTYVGACNVVAHAGDWLDNICAVNVLRRRFCVI